MLDDERAEGTAFAGDTCFVRVSLTGAAGFERAVFSGPTTFERTSFTGPAEFRAATFTDPTAHHPGPPVTGPDFRHAMFVLGPPAEVVSLSPMTP